MRKGFPNYTGSHVISQVTHHFLVVPQAPPVAKYGHAEESMCAVTDSIMCFSLPPQAVSRSLSRPACFCAVTQSLVRQQPQLNESCSSGKTLELKCCLPLKLFYDELIS